jgi:hypothetical protein
MDFFDFDTEEMDLDVIKTIVFSFSILLARVGIKIGVDEESNAFGLNDFCRVVRQLNVYRRSALHKLMEAIPTEHKLSSALDGSLAVGVENNERHFTYPPKKGCCASIFSCVFPTPDGGGVAYGPEHKNPISTMKRMKFSRANSFARHAAVDVEQNVTGAAREAQEAAFEMTATFQQSALDMEVRTRPDDAMENDFANLSSEYGLSA